MSNSTTTTIVVVVVVLILTVLMTAQSSIAIQSARAADETNTSNFRFSVAMLVIALLALLGSVGYLAYLGRQLSAPRAAVLVDAPGA